MDKIDLFENYPIFNSDKLFRKVVQITYEINYAYLYDCLKYLPYSEYLRIRNKVINYAVLNDAVKDTKAAKERFWERIVEQLEIQFNFVKPQSNSKDAERMRRNRGGI